jgi:hypothetical protein
MFAFAVQHAYDEHTLVVLPMEDCCGLLTNKLIVVGMRADPEPDKSVRGFNGNRAIMLTYARRPSEGMGASGWT